MYLLQTLQFMQLHSQHTHINRVLDDYSRHVSFLFLSNTKDTPKCLLFNCVVPPEVEGNATVGPREVETMNMLDHCSKRS